MPMSRTNYQLWLKRIQDAEDFQAAQHSRWQKALALYSTKYWEDLGFSYSWEDTIVPVNYATTFVSTLVSAIYARNPKMFTQARLPRFVPFAQTMDKALERHWDENNLKEVMLEVLIDTVLCGIGWAEAGFMPASGELLPQRQEVQEGFFGRIRQAVKAQLGQEEKLPVQEGELIEQKQPGEFYTIRRSPYEVLVPRGFTNYWQFPYIILKERLLLEDFLANPRYQAKDQIGHGTPMPRSQGETMAGPKYTFGGSNGQPTDTQVIDLYTPWDRRSQQVFTLSKLAQDPHVQPVQWPHYAEGFPVHPLRFNVVPNGRTESNFYPFGDVDVIFGQILEKAKIRTQMVEHRRRASLAVFVQKGTATEDELRNYAGATGVLEIVPVTNVQAIQVSQAMAIPQAIFQTEQAINSDLDRDSGLQLILADLARTGQIERATVAQIAQGNANLKSGFRVDRLEGFAKRLARYQAGLMWQYADRFYIGDIIGQVPSEEEWPPLPDDPILARQRVRRELEVRLETGSTRPIQDDVLDREQFIRASAVFQATSPSLFKRIEKQWMSELAKRFRIPSLEALILQAIDEREEQVAEQENQLLLKGAPQVVSETEDHEVHLTVHQKIKGQSPVGDGHIQAHKIKLQERLGSQRSAGQGVRQGSAAPSAAEVGRMGVPGMSDLQGQSMNLGRGTGGESVGP